MNLPIFQLKQQQFPLAICGGRTAKSPLETKAVSLEGTENLHPTDKPFLVWCSNTLIPGFKPEVSYLGN